MATFCSHAIGSADEILAAIMEEVAAFAGGAEQADDITCVVVKRA